MTTIEILLTMKHALMEMETSAGLQVVDNDHTPPFELTFTSIPKLVEAIRSLEADLHIPAGWRLSVYQDAMQEWAASFHNDSGDCVGFLARDGKIVSFDAATGAITPL